VPEKPHSSAPALALFEQADLIIDATDHKVAFERALRNAREEVIIHSTFVSEQSIPTVLPLLLAATAKGTRVTILWGQDDEKTAVSTSRAAINKLQTAVDEAGRSAQINIHRFTTRSHAKVLIADDGAGRWSAIVGSCNWPSSGFDSFEASIRLRDRALVGQTVRHIAALSLGSPGVWHEGATDLTVLGRRIESKTAESGRTAKMRLILSVDHGALVLEARDKAQRRIFVTSHRIGLAGRPMVIIPALSAAKSTQVRAELYYGRPTGVLSGVDAAGLAIEFARQGVGIKPTYQPRLHAKVLACVDAPAVERAKAAGGILIGKTTTSEFGCKPVGDSPLTGTTRNPWNLAKTPGGSSAGAAASVAAGITPFALGTDGGGSIRIPAAFTGLAGLKGQFGRVPVWPTGDADARPCRAARQVGDGYRVVVLCHRRL
jgi:hypothetical protein